MKRDRERGSGREGETGREIGREGKGERGEGVGEGGESGTGRDRGREGGGNREREREREGGGREGSLGDCCSQSSELGNPRLSKRPVSQKVENNRRR